MWVCVECEKRVYQSSLGVTDGQGRKVGFGFEWLHVADNTRLCDKMRVPGKIQPLVKEVEWDDLSGAPPLR